MAEIKLGYIAKYKSQTLLYTSLYGGNAPDFKVVVAKKRNASRVLVGKSEGKNPLERRRCRCEGNTKMNLKEVG